MQAVYAHGSEEEPEEEGIAVYQEDKSYER